MIYFDDDHIKVGGIVLPGVYKSIEVKQSAKVEEIEVEGSDSKPKQATGFEDAKINIEITLEDGDKTKYEKLETIQNMFRQSGQEKPVVHEIVSEQTSVRNITRVIFKDLSSKESNGKESLTVSLEFWEYVPVSVTATKSSKKSSSSSKGSSSSSSSSSSGSSSSSSSTLTAEYKSYLTTRGKSPNIKNKTSQSPTSGGE